VSKALLASAGPKWFVESVVYLSIRVECNDSDSDFSDDDEQHDHEGISLDQCDQLGAFSGIQLYNIDCGTNLQETINWFPNLQSLALRGHQPVLPMDYTLKSLTLYDTQGPLPAGTENLPKRFPKLLELSLSHMGYIGKNRFIRFPIHLNRLTCSLSILMAAKVEEETTIDELVMDTYRRGSSLRRTDLSKLTVGVLMCHTGEMPSKHLESRMRIKTLQLQLRPLYDNTGSDLNPWLSLLFPGTMTMARVEHIEIQTTTHSLTEVIRVIGLHSSKQSLGIPITIHGRSLPHPVVLSTSGPLVPLLEVKAPCSSHHCKICLGRS
jgi:hypothetical protein